MNTLYAFSGLGADKRVFSKIDFGQINVVFIKWIEPLKKESIQSYALPISGQIKEKSPILLGISFGGIIAQEVGKIVVFQKLILLATVESRSELPWYFRTIGLLKLDLMVPPFVLKSYNFASNWAFGIDTKENKRLLKAILKDTDPSFLKWAI
jgi:hypothetical protein